MPAVFTHLLERPLIVFHPDLYDACVRSQGGVWAHDGERRAGGQVPRSPHLQPQDNRSNMWVPLSAPACFSGRWHFRFPLCSSKREVCQRAQTCSVPRIDRDPKKRSIIASSLVPRAQILQWKETFDTQWQLYSPHFKTGITSLVCLVDQSQDRGGLIHSPQLWKQAWSVQSADTATLCPFIH